MRNNIIKHSQSPRAIIELRREGERTSIKIQDFGKGLSNSSNVGESSLTDGFGLESTGQRVKLMGGQMKIDSIPSEGTTINIDLNY